MRSLNNFDLLFWAGIAVIIFFYVGFLYVRFRQERFVLEEHLWIAILYILLMVLTIIVWRYVFDIFFSKKLLQILQIQLNGE